MSTLAKLKNTMGTANQPRATLGKNSYYKSILDVVGHTPLIKLAKIPKIHGLDDYNFYAKCEFLNPSGSNKDRIGVGMVQDALNNHKVHPKTVFVEPSSGNTGIAIALNATLLEKGCIIVTKEKDSDEKVNTITLLGAEVIQLKDTEDEEKVAQSLVDKDPNNLMLEQFINPVNPFTHYETMGMEIATALETNVDMVVMGIGTGGTITGVGSRLKNYCEVNFPGKKTLVIAAEPDGSTMVNTSGTSHPFLIEGIGGNVAPLNLDKSVLDGFEVVTDEEAFLMARNLALKEGLLCGGSSGAIMTAAIRAVKSHKLEVGSNIVVILPDGIRNYMDKFVSNQWMEALLFMDPPKHTMKWWADPIEKLDLTMKYPEVSTSDTCTMALKKMNEISVDIAVVNDINHYFVGVVTKDALRNYATNPKKYPETSSEEINFDSPVTEYLMKHCFTLALNGKKGMPTVGLLSRILDITPFVVIGSDCKDGVPAHFSQKAVVTADLVLDYIQIRSS